MASAGEILWGSRRETGRKMANTHDFTAEGYRQRAAVWGRIYDLMESLGMPMSVATAFLEGEPVSVECCVPLLDRIE